MSNEKRGSFKLILTNNKRKRSSRRDSDSIPSTPGISQQTPSVSTNGVQTRRASAGLTATAAAGGGGSGSSSVASADRSPARRKPQLPNDPATLEKIRTIVRTQFDFEILLKRREIQTVKEEIETGEDALQRLHHFIINGPEPPSAPSSTDASIRISSSGRPVRAAQSAYRDRKPTRPGDERLFARRDDGVYVTVHCPKCQRSTFVNMQGFLNHCRISHSIEFPSHSTLLLNVNCIKDESEVPENSAARRMLVRPAVFQTPSNYDWGEMGESEPGSSKQPSAPSTTPKSRPKIKVYDEDVDMDVGPVHKVGTGMDNGLAISTVQDSVEGTASPVVCMPSPVGISDMSGLPERTEDECAATTLVGDVDNGKGTQGPTGGGVKLQVEKDGTAESMAGLANGNGGLPKEEASLDHVIPMEIDSVHPASMEIDASPQTVGVTSTFEVVPGQKIAEVRAIQGVNGEVGGHDERLNGDTETPDLLGDDEATVIARRLEKGKQRAVGVDVASVSVPMDVDAGRVSVPGGSTVTNVNGDRLTPSATPAYPDFWTSDEGSRFYIKRRIVQFNIDSDKREPGMERFLYKWMVYIRGPPMAEDLTPFVKKVRFFLHPDYRPYDVVDVNDPPFHLTRYGWGEFPIRLQLHFCDLKNKAVDIIHIIKLDTQRTARQVFGSERTFDIELDRNTEFAPSREETEKTRKPSEDKPDAAAKLEDMSLDDTEQPDVDTSDAAVIDRALAAAVGKYPIIRPGGIKAKPVSLPYTTAPSLNLYMTWSIGKRKAIEWQRARLLKEDVRRPPSMTNPALQSLTTKQVVLWCREHGHTPTQSAKPSSALPSSSASTSSIIPHGFAVVTPSIPLPPEPQKTPGTYCRYCGAAHVDPDGLRTFDDLVRECEQRPGLRRGKLSSLTPAADVVSGLEEDVVGVDDDMDIVVDTMTNPLARAATPSTNEKGSLLPASISQWDSPHPTASEQDLRWVFDSVKQLRLATEWGDEKKKGGAVSGLVFEATRVFLSRLLQASVSVARAEQNSPTPPPPPPQPIPPNTHPPIEDTTTPATSTSTTITPTMPPPSLPGPTPLPRTKLLVPLHVFKAATANPDKFDFLTNASLASSGGSAG
ncbi:YEATS domain-containing protein 2 [Borealophlyctis nickersoniae]|nr:YEATS domain-containing protein 2 [Borealophlyctis nickersoniae]